MCKGVSEQERKSIGLPVEFVYVAVIAAAILGYFSAFDWILPVWLTAGSHYSHGLLVVGVVGFRLWQDKAYLVRDTVNNRWLVVLWFALFVASAVWFVSALGGIRVPGTFAALAVMWLGISIVIGRGGVWRLFPYFVLLYSVVPIWQPLVNPMLQAMATEVVNTLLQLFDLTIYMEGNTIVMPDVVFKIVGGCSGLGYLLVALTLSIYLVLTDRLRGFGAASLIALFMGFALLSNWIRITLIMLFGYFEGPTHPLIGNHIWFGWVVYGAIFLPVLWFLPPRFVKMSAHIPPKINEEGNQVKYVSRAVFFGTVAAVLTLPILAVAINAGTALRTFEPVLKSSISGYVEVELADKTWQPEYPSASVTHLQHFQSVRDRDDIILFFKAFYENQSDGVEVTDTQNRLQGTTWERINRDPSTIQIGYGNGAGSKLELSSVYGNKRLVVWYWYQVGGMQVGSLVEAKAAQILGKLQFRADGALFAAATYCSSDNCDDATVRLRSFIEAFEFEQVMNARTL